MRVMFITGGGADIFVEYGEEGEVKRTVKSEVKRYKLSDMCDAPANSPRGWRDPGYIHDAVMKDLKAGKRYLYRVRISNFLSLELYETQEKG